jgi:hypothetical protein
MIDAATIPNEETGEVAVVNELDKAYNEHRFELYFSRLLDAPVYKAHLQAELANPTRVIGDEADYSEESWTDYQNALTFATATANEADANATKVKTAYRELLEAEKRLVAPSEGGDEPSGDVSFEPIDVVELVEGEDGSSIITGIGYDLDSADYFVCEGCYVELIENEEGTFSTGAVLNIVDEATGDVLASYNVAVYADINGDYTTDLSEVSQAVTISSGSVIPSAVVAVAADVNLDGAADIGDLSLFLAAASGSMLVDPVAREIA